MPRQVARYLLHPALASTTKATGPIEAGLSIMHARGQVMKKQVYIALAASVLGGILSQLIASSVAFAQAQPSVQKEIRAQNFVLTDDAGNTVGVFSTVIQRVTGKRAIVLFDQTGKQIWSAGDSPLRQLSQR